MKKCRYCKGPITEQSPSYYNCGCRTVPSPSYLPVSYVLANDVYKQAVEDIHHASLHYERMSEEDLRKTLGEIFTKTKETILTVAEIHETHTKKK